MKRYILIEHLNDEYEIIDTNNDEYEYVYDDEKCDFLDLEIEEPYEDETGCWSRFRYKEIGYIVKESNNIRELEKLISKKESK